MRELLLDAETYYTREQVHQALADVFGFSADYGGTLDALYDEICICPPTRLTLRHAEVLVGAPGKYGEFMPRGFASAGSGNPDFLLNF